MTAGIAALWVYDYFLTLSDEASTSLVRAAAMFDTRRADRVYLVWEAVIWCVILSSSDLREDSTNESPVLVLFILVGSLLITMAHPILLTVKNRYWPLFSLLWTLVGGPPSQFARRPLTPCPNSQTAYFCPAYTKQVRNTQCGDPEHCSHPSLDVRFAVLRLQLELDSQFTYKLDSRCDKTAWPPMLYYVFATLFAQSAITLRLATDSNHLTPTA